MGLDGLCVTDHDSMGIAAEVDALRRECGFPLFVGIEVLTTGGDFVVFGLDRAPSDIPTSCDAESFGAWRSPLSRCSGGGGWSRL